MVAQATMAAARVASTGGTRLRSILLEAARGSARHRAAGDLDAGRVHLLQVARLYRLVLDRLPDRPGLRHHADLLSNGSTLSELAASLLAVSDSADRDRGAVARVLWARAGGEASGFAARWRAASSLADFVAELVRHPVRRDATLLPAWFPDGIDPTLSDAGPAWAYRLWTTEIDAELERLARRTRGVLRLVGPRIVLVVTLGDDTPVDQIDASLASLARQIYGRWRVHLRGTAPPGWSPPTDPRIAWHAHASATSRRGMARPVLDGVLGAGDVLAPSCLAIFALAATRRPSVSLWCCDEDRIRQDGARELPRLHRDGGLLLRRRGATATDVAQRHLPAVLLHRALRQPGTGGADRPATCAPDTALASLVIVTRDRPALLRRCLDSLAATTGAPGSDGAPEIVIVDNGTTDAEALRILEQRATEGCVVLRRPGPFNWSALCNEGVRASAGAVVVLLNNDVECIRPDWLTVLLNACRDPATGVVGARLLYPDGRVQHNGVLVGTMTDRGPGRWSGRLRGRRPVAAHRLDGSETGTRAVAAVTGACMAFRRDLFDRLGGLEEALPVTWNDMDFCFRVREAGFRVRVAAGCTLLHHELGTRTPDTAPENQAQLRRTIAFVARRHRRMLRRDGFLHPFLMVQGGARLLDPRAPLRLGRLLRRGGVACETALAAVDPLD